LTLLFKSSDAEIEQAATLLKRGALAIIPTETVYGIACDERNEAGIERLYQIKGRDKNKPVARLVSGIEQIIAHGGQVTDTLKKLIEKYSPGPITYILDHPEYGSMGYRIPDHPVALKLLTALDAPLMASSANKSGEADASTCQEALVYFSEDQIDFAIDAGPSTLKRASTVVQCSHNSLEILREGSISRAEIMRNLNER